MKHLLIIILFGWVALVACKKSTLQDPKTFFKKITGTWKYTQKFYSEGGPIVYESTTYLNQRVVFNNDNSFSSNVPAFKNFNNYEIQDSFKVKFTSTLPPDHLYFYYFDSLQNSLSLISTDFICIEPCGDIFKK